MQLRFLKRARSRLNVWPPSEGGRYGLRDRPGLQKAGVSTAASRIGNRLSVTIRFEGREHIGFLHEWAEPPTVDELHAALRSVVGKRIWEVGHLDIAEARQRDEAGYQLRLLGSCQSCHHAAVGASRRILRNQA